MVVENHQIAVSGGVVRVARLEDETYASVHRVDDLLERLRGTADLFTFRQRLPDWHITYPQWHHEPDPIAAIEVTTAENWQRSLSHTARHTLKKARKSGLAIRPTDFDAAFIGGMHAIFNESPVRQGKPFLHYGKPVEQLRQEFARFLFREEIFGAYLGNELVGFIFLAENGTSLQLGQIISTHRHRELGTNNLLIAAGVERCVTRRVPFLVYADWSDGTLGDFKRRNGFVRIDLPRYYIPLTHWGRIALTLRLHKGWRETVPTRVRQVARQIRRWRYAQ